MLKKFYCLFFYNFFNHKNLFQYNLDKSKGIWSFKAEFINLG